MSRLSVHCGAPGNIKRRHLVEHEAALSRWSYDRALDRFNISGALALFLSGRRRLRLKRTSLLARAHADDRPAAAALTTTDPSLQPTALRIIGRRGEQATFAFIVTGEKTRACGLAQRLAQEHALASPQGPDDPIKRTAVLNELEQLTSSLREGSLVLLRLKGSRLLGDAIAAQKAISPACALLERVARLQGVHHAAQLEEDLIAILGPCVQETSLPQGMREAIDASLDLAQGHLTWVAGTASFPRDGSDVRGLCRAAGIALEQANERGNAQIVAFDAAHADAADEKLALACALRGAVARDEMELRFQPILDVREQRVEGIEILMRWRHPVRGYVPPDLFVPLAEEIGLIAELGEWVLERARHELAPILALAGNLKIGINLSPKQLEPAVVERLLVGLRKLGAINVMVEVTETALLESSEVVDGCLSTVRDTGCKIALDDFGTGFSSLAHLDRHPIDTLKIDKQFIQKLGEGGDGGRLVEAILFMASALDLDTVAEGVETLDQLAWLTSKGCRFAQGYLFAKPLTAVELDRFLRDFRYPNEALDAVLWPRAQGLPRLLSDNHEQVLSLFVKHVPAAVAMLDPDMRYLAASDRWLEDYHLLQEEIIGRSHDEVVATGSPGWRGACEEALSGRAVACEEELWQSPLGRQEWLRWQVMPFRNGVGDVSGVMVASELVTARKEAERRRCESEERLADFLDTASDWLWETDRDHRLTFVSHSVGSVGWGLSADLGKRRWEIPGVDTEEPAWQTHLSELDAHRPVRNFRYARCDAQGTRGWREISGKPLFDENGEFKGYRGTARDISKEKAAEAQLQHLHDELARSHALLREATSILHDGFALFDPDDKILLCNTSFAALYERQPDDLVGATAEELVRQLTARYQEDLDEAEREKVVEQRLRAHHAADGKPFAVQLDDRCLLVREQRTPSGLTVLLRSDVSEIERFKADLVRLENEAQGARHLLSRAVSVMVDAIAIFDPEDKLIVCNEAFSAGYGRSPDGLVGLRFEETQRLPEFRKLHSLDGSSFERWLDERLRVHREGVGTPFVSRFLGGWYMTRDHCLEDGTKIISRTDVGALKETEGELRRLTEELENTKRDAENARDRLAEAAAALPDGLAIVDADERVILCNDAFAVIQDSEPEALVGLSLTDFTNSLARRLRDKAEVALVEAWRATCRCPQEVFNSPLELEIDGSLYLLRNARVGDGSLVLTCTDVTHLCAGANEARQTAGYGMPGDLASPRQFLDQAGRAHLRARIDAQPIALLLLRLDLSQTGEDATDDRRRADVLRDLAGLVAEIVRPHDLLARWSNCELVILLPNADGASVRSIALRLRHAVDSFVCRKGRKPWCAVRVGTAFAEPAKDDLYGMILQAQEALGTGGCVMGGDAAVAVLPPCEPARTVEEA